MTGTRCVCEDIVSSSVKVFFPTLLARLAWYKQAIPGAGVLEFQIDFPSPTLDSSDGEPVSTVVTVHVCPSLLSYFDLADFPGHALPSPAIALPESWVEMHGKLSPSLCIAVVLP